MKCKSLLDVAKKHPSRIIEISCTYYFPENGPSTGKAGKIVFVIFLQGAFEPLIVKYQTTNSEWAWSKVYALLRNKHKCYPGKTTKINEKTIAEWKEYLRA